MASAPARALAQEPPVRAAAGANEPAEPPRRDYDARSPDVHPLTYVRAAAHVAVVNWMVWQFDWIRQDEFYLVTGQTLADNFRHGFTFDTDGITTNLYAHPLAGGLDFEAARALGLGFWESVPYAFAGSASWELVSERQYPSTNDFVSTSLGGVAIGEMLHRVSSLALDDSKSGGARLSRELLGAVISPVRGLTRLTSGEAWASGPAPIDKPARIEAHLGFDRVRFETLESNASYAPSALAAIDVEYGDLVPRDGATTIPAYDFFELYAAGIVSQESLSGVQLSTYGLLHGFSSDLSSDVGPSRDNNVLGFVQTVDFQGADVAKFGAFGLGIADIVVDRAGPRRLLRLAVDLSTVPLAAASSPITPFNGTDVDRNYNFSIGASVGLRFQWELGRFGIVDVRAREYGTRVVDGTDGREIIGYARGSYEVDIARDRVGIGVAPTLIHRTGRYVGGRMFRGAELTNQLYLTVHL